MALTKKGDNINWFLIFERPKTVEEKGGGKERRRGRGREEEEKRRRKEDQRYGFYDFWYGYYMESKDLMVLYGILGNFMSSKT